MPRLTKTIEYRRAAWFDQQLNLEILVRQAWGQFQTHLERTTERADNSTISGLRSEDFGQQGFAIHCARYTDRQGVGVIPMAPALNADLGERAPGQDENFMNSDFIALFRNNNIVSLSAGRSAGALRDFLWELFRKAGLAENTRKFDLVRVADANKIAMIEAAGVKSIDLKLSLAEATAEHVADGQAPHGIWSSLVHVASESISAITATDRNIGQLRAARKGTVTLSINVPRGDLTAAKSGLDALAQAVVNDEESDEFSIALRNGQVIKPSEVSVRKTVALEAVANTVSVTQAWAAMQTFMGELIDTGQIEA